MPIKFKRNISGTLFPSVPMVGDSDARRKLLTTITSTMTNAPEYTGPYEESRVPFSLEAALGLAIEPYGALYVRRVKKHPWLIQAYDSFPWLKFTSPSPELMPDAWNAWDRLVELLHPHFAIFGLTWRDTDPSPRAPWANEMELSLELSDRAGRITTFLHDNGTRGLGMRTDFGPFLVNQFGRDRFAKIPGIVRDLPWGGVRVDLSADPWKLKPEEFAQLWNACMAPLRESGLLWAPVIDNAALGRISFAPSNLNLKFPRPVVSPQPTKPSTEGISEAHQEELDRIDEARDQHNEVSEVDLSEAKLRNYVFDEMSGESFAFAKADLTGASFSDCNLSDVDLAEATLTGASFEDAKLFDIHANGVLAEHMNMTGASLTSSFLKEAKLSDAAFEKARLDDVYFQESSLCRANFSKCRLANAYFEKANLDSANFREARLENVDFTSSNLSRVDFTGATFKDVNWSGAKLDGTIFDSGTKGRP